MKIPLYERISIVVSLTLIGLVFYFILESPPQSTSFTLFGLSQQWLMTILLAGMAMAGADTVTRSHPSLADRRLGYLASFWMLPGLLTMLATRTLSLSPNLTIWVAALAGMGLLLWLTIVAGFQQITADISWAKLWQRLVGYGLALAFFSLIYSNRTSPIAILLISVMIALPLLRQKPPELILKSWLFSAVIGLSMGQAYWALTYWRIGLLTAGLLLLLSFYVMVSLAQQQLSGRLSKQTLWEFGAVTAVSLIVIFNL